MSLVQWSMVKQTCLDVNPSPLVYSSFWPYSICIVCICRFLPPPVGVLAACTAVQPTDAMVMQKQLEKGLSGLPHSPKFSSVQGWFLYQENRIIETSKPLRSVVRTGGDSCPTVPNRLAQVHQNNGSSPLSSISRKGTFVFNCQTNLNKMNYNCGRSTLTRGIGIVNAPTVDRTCPALSLWLRPSLQLLMTPSPFNYYCYKW